MEQQLINEENEYSPESVIEYYNHIKLIIESMESDALKNDKGNKAAGVRLRKSLRHLKTKTSDFVKYTLSK